MTTVQILAAGGLMGAAVAFVVWVRLHTWLAQDLHATGGDFVIIGPEGPLGAEDDYPTLEAAIAAAQAMPERGELRILHIIDTGGEDLEPVEVWNDFESRPHP